MCQRLEASRFFAVAILLYDRIFLAARGQLRMLAQGQRPPPPRSKAQTCTGANLSCSWLSLFMAFPCSRSEQFETCLAMSIRAMVM
jgi:hypothetical protein